MRTLSQTRLRKPDQGTAIANHEAEVEFRFVRCVIQVIAGLLNGAWAAESSTCVGWLASGFPVGFEARGLSMLCGNFTVIRITAASPPRIPTKQTESFCH